jgi:hypothetical protein
MDKSKSKAAHGWVRGECFQEENSVSSPIMPPRGPIATGTAHSASGPRRTGAAFPLAPPSAQGPSRAFPSSPPPEVLEKMTKAAATHERLHAQDRELHFAHDAQSGRMTIQVRDGAGHVLRSLSPSEALDVAAGKPLE